MAPRSSWIDGSATFTTVLSSMIMKSAKHIAPSVHHLRLRSVIGAQAGHRRAALPAGSSARSPVAPRSRRARRRASAARSRRSLAAAPRAPRRRAAISRSTRRVALRGGAHALDPAVLGVLARSTRPRRTRGSTARLAAGREMPSRSATSLSERRLEGGSSFSNESVFSWLSVRSCSETSRMKAPSLCGGRVPEEARQLAGQLRRPRAGGTLDEEEACTNASIAGAPWLSCVKSNHTERSRQSSAECGLPLATAAAAGPGRSGAWARPRARRLRRPPCPRPRACRSPGCTVTLTVAVSSGLIGPTDRCSRGPSMLSVRAAPDWLLTSKLIGPAPILSGEAVMSSWPITTETLIGTGGRSSRALGRRRPPQRGAARRGSRAAARSRAAPRARGPSSARANRSPILSSGWPDPSRTRPTCARAASR